MYYDIEVSDRVLILHAYCGTILDIQYGTVLDIYYCTVIYYIYIYTMVQYRLVPNFHLAMWRVLGSLTSTDSLGISGVSEESMERHWTTDGVLGQP